MNILWCVNSCDLPYVSCDLPHVSCDLILCRISDIQNVTVAMETLVNYFEPSCKDGDEADGEATMVTV